MSKTTLEYVLNALYIAITSADTARCSRPQPRGLYGGSLSGTASNDFKAALRLGWAHRLFVDRITGNASRTECRLQAPADGHLSPQNLRGESGCAIEVGTNENSRLPRRSRSLNRKHNRRTTKLAFRKCCAILSCSTPYSSKWQHRRNRRKRHGKPYVAAVTQNATLAVANIASRHAELRGLPFESWPAVLQSLANSNPQRYSQIMSEFASARNVFDQFERAAADQTQRYQQQLNQAATQMQQRFQADANFADSQLDQYRQQQGISDAEFKELQAEAFNQLRQAGYSDQDIAIQYNSNPQFRSFYAQQQMLNSARWALAQRSLATKVAPKAVPPMQRPGSPLLVSRDRDIEMRNLEKTLNHTSSVKDATRVLLARREMAKKR